MATEDNHQKDEITAANRPAEPQKKDREAGQGPAEQSGAPDLLKKEYPKPDALKQKKPVLPNIPSRVSLKDIPLPAYMKGAVKKVFSQQKSPLSQSAREIGLGPERTPIPERMNVVSVSPENRTEIDTDGIPVIRTYADDMKREMKRRGATLTSIVGEERARSAKQKLSAGKALALPKRNILLIAGALVLIGVGVAALAAALILTKKDEILPPETKLIYTNAQKIVFLDESSTLPALLARARADSKISLGETENFVIAKNGAVLSPEEVLILLGAPPALARNALDIMVGVHSFDRNQPFIIITTSFYDLSFQAMLAWETSIAETLGDFFKPVQAPSSVPPPLAFLDTIFKNVDVRKSNAEWPILYTFPERDILIITTNQNTLNEILTRVSASSAR